ncbi:prepilin-type N-terminal cleavage/methylation domain-containing protein [Actinotalea ferrariae]|uniref:type II secretion system protein n=1 Tax=Actinotalea ferrariae TaxID=1386098 RepID=UPI001C8CBF4E|nr:prepilin-type N-terminal cleavage/methylation domain-containing protein [Actinotalea ferrariae]MBX9245857.1 prepilin-type N-terminal cleavage/methylation domain-containing protein [Actinotalea ferrariae]
MELQYSRARQRLRRGDDAGVTLIEVVIAAVLLGILASAVLGIVVQAQSAQVGNRARVAAANLAAREIDMVREEFVSSSTAPLALAAAGVVTNPHKLPGGTTGQPLVVDGKPYTVVRSAAWNITGTGQSACEGGSLVAHPTLTITVTVTWPNMGTIKPVTSSTVLAPQKGTGIPTTAGFVAVTVKDSTGAPNPGRAVRVANGSDIRSGLTDASGCAVIQVAPAAAGTEYTVSLSDSDHVDIANNSNPSKVTGLVKPGVLNNGAKFTYDRSGTVRVTITGPGGAPISPADLDGGQITLLASESSGTTGAVTRDLDSSSSLVQEFPGLWPTNYGAFVGSTAPAAGYLTQKLTPGGTIDLTVEFELATTSVTNLPAGTAAVWVSKTGTGAACGQPGARRLDNPAAVTLAPAEWDFYAEGGPLFGCSPGPSAVTLDQGANGPVVWGTSSLSLSNLPATGVVWAVEASKVPTAPTGGACPSGVAAPSVQNINDVVRAGGAVPLAAGTYYVYVTDGPSTGACLSTPGVRYPFSVPYGSAPATLAWPAATPQPVTVTGVPSLGCHAWGCFVARYWPTVIASTDSNVSCNQSSVNRPYISFGASPSSSSGDNGTYSGSLSGGTWYVFRWDTRSSGGGNKCTSAGTVIVGSRPVTLPFGATAPVGP